MKPIILITLIFYAIFGRCFAQNHNITTLFKDDGQQVNYLDSADFIRVVSEPDSGSKLFNVNEYYKDKRPRLVAKSWNPENMQFEGQAQWFYPNGKKKEMANYHEARKNGDDYLYYPNGKIYLHKKYLADAEKIGNNDVLFLDCRDSTGKDMATAGTGHIKVYDDKFSYVYEEGQVKNGLRESEWKGDNNDDKHHITFTEIYENGNLTKGVAVHSTENKTYNYTVRQVQPQFFGGLEAFGKYLGTNIKYPVVSRFNHVQGRVIVSFVVERDGVVDDFKVKSSPDGYMAQEAVRVLSASPKWVPGYQFGETVRVNYTVPVNFKFD